MEAETRLAKDRFEIVECLLDLGAHVPFVEGVSVSVYGGLTGAVADALRAADLVCLDEAELVIAPLAESLGPTIVCSG